MADKNKSPDKPSSSSKHLRVASENFKSAFNALTIEIKQASEMKQPLHPMHLRIDCEYESFHTSQKS